LHLLPHPPFADAADGESFAVDAAGGLEAVPASHRQEVEAKLRAIQQFAATALRAAA
jgi:hypothetical protein